MLVIKTKFESIIRAALVAAILLSALAPAIGLARPALAQGEEPTATPTATVTETPPVEPTEPPIATETPVPATETPEPASTLDPVATDALETDALSSKAEAAQLSLSLSSTPTFLSGSGIVTLHWTIEGYQTAPAPLTLEISIPIGFEPQKEQAADQFDPATGLFTTTVTAAQEHVQVQVPAAVQADA